MPQSQDSDQHVVDQARGRGHDKEATSSAEPNTTTGPKQDRTQRRREMRPLQTQGRKHHPAEGPDAHTTTQRCASLGMQVTQHSSDLIMTRTKKEFSGICTRLPSFAPIISLIPLCSSFRQVREFRLTGLHAGAVDECLGQAIIGHNICIREKSALALEKSRRRCWGAGRRGRPSQAKHGLAWPGLA